MNWTAASCSTDCKRLVAERLGFDRNEALTLGRSVAVLNAPAKASCSSSTSPHQTASNKAQGA